MTDEELAAQIKEALLDVLKDEEERAPLMRGYLSGVEQCAHFLIMRDGGVLPHQVQRAVAMVAEELGFK